MMLLSCAETAKRLGISPRMVRYLSAPPLERVKIGRQWYFTEAEVERLAARRQARRSSAHTYKAEANGEGQEDGRPESLEGRAEARGGGDASAGGDEGPR